MNLFDLMFRLHRAPVIGLVAATLAVATEAAWIVRNRTEMVESLAKGRQLQDRRLQLLRQTPSPTPEIAAQIVAARQSIERAAEAGAARLIAGSIEPEDSRATEPVRERAGAYFDLAWFVEEMRATAVAEDIQLMEGESFGFSSHAHSGPASEHIGRVLRQRLHLERLLKALFSVRPARLESVRRESPLPGSAAARVGADPAGADYFRIDPASSLRRSGVIDTLAFRLVFVGNTGCLRDFLNRLMEDETPWMVRLVEVEPAARAGAGRPAGNPSGKTVSRIGPALSRFALTIETIERLGATPAGREKSI